MTGAETDGLVVYVNNQVFAAPAMVDLTGSTLTAGPVTTRPSVATSP